MCMTQARLHVEILGGPPLRHHRRHRCFHNRSQRSSRHVRIPILLLFVKVQDASLSRVLCHREGGHPSRCTPRVHRPSAPRHQSHKLPNQVSRVRSHREDRPTRHRAKRRNRSFPRAIFRRSTSFFNRVRYTANLCSRQLEPLIDCIRIHDPFS